MTRSTLPHRARPPPLAGTRHDHEQIARGHPQDHSIRPPRRVARAVAVHFARQLTHQQQVNHMRSRQDAILAALRRAQRFLTENLTQLTSVVDMTVALKRLDDVITSLSAHALEQDVNNRSAKGETEKQRQLRLTLRKEQMQPIAEIARQDLSTVSEFKELQMPPRSAKGERFIASASAMAKAAAKYKTALLERGLP